MLNITNHYRNANKSYTNNETYINTFKELLSNHKQAYEKMWKFFSIDYKEKIIPKILKNSINKGSNLVEILGYSHTDNHLKFLKDHLQVGVFILLGINDNIMLKNEIYLAYKIIYEMYKNYEKKDEKFLKYLKEDINLELDTKNPLNNNSQLIRSNNEKNYKFLEVLKTIFQRRFLELTSQYYYFDNNTGKNDKFEMIGKLNKLEDRQRILDLLFNKEKRIVSIDDEINSLREEFSTFGNIKIFVGSWNTGNTNINKYNELSLDSWLKPKNDKIIPDIYLIGLQEVVELSTANIDPTANEGMTTFPPLLNVS